MSFTELQKLPVRYRHWYVKRLSKHFDKKNEIMNKSSNDTGASRNSQLNRIEEMFNKKLE